MSIFILLVISLFALAAIVAIVKYVAVVLFAVFVKLFTLGISVAIAAGVLYLLLG